METWFADVKNSIDVKNDDQLIRDPDGAYLVWIFGEKYGSPCLNVDIIREGLAEVNYAPWENYSFIFPAPADDPPYPWKEELDAAKKAGQEKEGQEKVSVTDRD